MLPSQNEYREIYARYNAQLKAGQRLETEVRLYDVFPKEQRSAEDGPQGMTIYFDRLMSYLRADKELVASVTDEYSEVYISGDIRHIVTTKGRVREDLWERKQSVFSRDIAEYKMRFALSLEETLDPEPNFVPTLTRRRQRTSFVLRDPEVQARVDMTKTMEIGGKSAAPKWEVEVEFGGDLIYLNAFEKVLAQIYCIFRGTDNVYNLSTRDRMITDIGSLFEARTIPRGALVEARNIKRKDLVYGGIVGNRRLQDPNLTTHELHLLVTIQDPEYQVTLERWEHYLNQYYQAESTSRVETASYDRFRSIRSSEAGMERREQLHVFDFHGLRKLNRSSSRSDSKSEQPSPSLNLVIDQLSKDNITDFVPVTTIQERIHEFFPERAYSVRFIRGSFDPRVEIRFRGGWKDVREWLILLSELIGVHRWINRSYQPEKFIQDMTRVLERYLSAGTRYAVTFKADGERKMLIFHKTGIWLVYPPFEYNLVLTPATSRELNSYMERFSGTILDGEYVLDKSDQRMYLPFDCLTFQGENYQGLPYLARREIIQALVPLIKHPKLPIQVKDLAVVETVEQFFTQVRIFLQRRAGLSYREDGLMFIPIDVIYNPESQHASDRVLTRVPDTCKWKEPHDITIDFALRPLPDGRFQLLSYDRTIANTNRGRSPAQQQSPLVPFTGSEINPFTPDMIEITKEPELEAGTVAEYAFIEGKLRLKVVRYNKIGRPNTLSVALDNWKDVHDPITALDLSGLSLDMTFSYHNRIKKRLFGLGRNASTASGSASLVLDIGSGRGGDVAKWKSELRSSQIVAVEPNADHRQELQTRVTRFGMDNKVLIVPASGEDSQTIVEALGESKADCIALMLSLSFFWRSEAHLDALVSTIVHTLAPGGTIIFLTIDGEAVRELFHPTFAPEMDLTLSRVIGPATITLEEPVVYFSLPGTIVGQQEEYLVRIGDLVQRLGAYGIELASYYRAQEERFLSPENALFTSLYSFGHFQWRVQIPRELPRLQNMGNADSRITDIPTEVNTNVVPAPNLRLAPPKIRGRAPAKEATAKGKAAMRPPAMVPKGKAKASAAPPVPASIPASTVTITTTTPVTTSVTTTTTATTVPVTKNTPAASVTTTTTPVTTTTTSTKREPNRLRWLSVQYQPKGTSFPLKGPAINDDTCAPIKQSIAPDLYRIACIGDGHCLIHAVLKAIYPPYQALQSAQGRIDMARSIRSALATLVAEPNPNYNDFFTYWESMKGGVFVDNALRRLIYPDMEEDYTLEGLQRLLNSNADLGEEAILLLSEFLDIDIFIFHGTADDIQLARNTVSSAKSRMAAVLLGNGTHFEVIAVPNADGTFQVAYQGPQDPFIQSILASVSGSEEPIISYTDKPVPRLSEQYRSFINLILKNGVTIQQLHNALRDKYPDTNHPLYNIFTDAGYPVK